MQTKFKFPSSHSANISELTPPQSDQSVNSTRLCCLNLAGKWPCSCNVRTAWDAHFGWEAGTG